MSGRVEEIFQELLGKILGDVYPAGMRLPSERDLAAHYGTNRSTLREALRQLERCSLVKIRHGQGATVQDFRRDATMESLGDFLVYAKDPCELVRVVDDLLRVRTQVLCMSLELAASRATQEDLVKIDRVVQDQLSHFEKGDRQALAQTDVQFINILIDAAHSLTARWIANSILDVYRSLLRHSTALWVYDTAFPDYLCALQAAIAEGDGPEAAHVTREYFDRVDGTLVSALQMLASTGHLSS